MKSAYLVMVESSNNHNKYYQMTQKTADVFEVQYGRVGAKGMLRTYPISRWDSIYQSKLAKGYIDNSSLYVPVKKSKYNEISDVQVRTFWEEIESYSKKVLESNYSVSYEKVTSKMIQEASDILIRIQRMSDVNYINEMLLELFQTVPRRMAKVSEYLLKDIADLPDVLEREWELLDVMKGHMTETSNKMVEINKNILESLGLSISLVTDEKRIAQIKNHLGNENWYGLMTKGPLLRPQGVIITGKAFGNGIYFAPRAKKSIGYSSLRGAYWTGGMQNKGYLAVYKVLFKNQKDVNVSYPYSLSNIRPHDAVYAHKGVILQNDEVIIFREEQATLQYIIELNA